MSENQQRFVEEYTVDCNGAAAARRAGYSESSARQIAYELLQNEEVSAAISERLKSLAMSADEAAKHISDIARTRLNDFFVIRQVEARELTEQYVTVLLGQTQERIEAIRQFIRNEGLESKGGGAFKRQIRKLQELMLEYQTDIDCYGNDVTRLAPGRPVLKEVAELDLVALAKAKESGRIKSFALTEYGAKVELYAADSALGKILEYHGKIIQKHEVKVTQITGMTIL
jgi:hypothetical protein